MVDERVRYIFNQMSADYDDLRDLWYSWLFSRLHFLIAKHLISEWEIGDRHVLDVGCGTGLQSFLYALAGPAVTGVDISDQLIAVAQDKARVFRKRYPCSLFSSHFEFVKKYDEKIASLLRSRFYALPYIAPAFRCADGTDLPFESGTFDHVNCCGSTLNFVETYKTALSEMSRVLKSNGTFVIEVDAKYNADLVWTVVDSLMFGLLHYETTLRDALNAALSRPKAHIKVQYPFGGDGDPIYMNLRLFTRKGLVEDLRQCGLEAVHTLSIHSLTNIIPSTFLDDGTPSNSLKRVFNLLASIEERLPFYLPGCSIVIFGKKTASPAHV